MMSLTYSLKCVNSPLTNDLILINLDLIFRSNNQCLHKDDFVDLNQKRIADSSELVTYLLNNNLIEIEEDASVFYLTTEGYEVHESWVWYDPDLIPEMPVRRVQDSYSLPDVQKEKVIRPSVRMKVFIVGFLVMIGTYIIQGELTEKEKPYIPSNLIQEEFENNRDSLRLNHEK